MITHYSSTFRDGSTQGADRRLECQRVANIYLIDASALGGQRVKR